MKLQNQKILITGGSSGIGFAMAKALIDLGNQVITADRNPEKQAKAKIELPQLICFPCDVTKAEDRERLVLYIEQEHADLSILINNAGIQYYYQFTESNSIPSQVQAEIATNLEAPIHLCGLLLPVLSRQQESAIVNITSGLAWMPKQSAIVYCATKAGLQNFSRGLRYQLEETPIRVVELIPPLVETAMTKGRGKDKVSPEVVAQALVKGLQAGKTEILVGKIKLLKMINRWLPALAERILRNG